MHVYIVGKRVNHLNFFKSLIGFLYIFIIAYLWYFIISTNQMHLVWNMKAIFWDFSKEIHLYIHESKPSWILLISVSKLHEAFTIQCSIAVWNHYMNNNARSAKMSLNIKALKKFNVIFRYIQFHCANPNLKKKSYSPCTEFITL